MHGMEGIRFYPRLKTVTSRWPSLSDGKRGGGGSAAAGSGNGCRRAFEGHARRLGVWALFVLPSTSPANAAVPWDERLRWFQAFSDALSAKVARTTSQPPA